MERAQRRVLIQYPKRQVRNAARCRGALASAAQAQHRRRDPADLRLVAAADAADHRPVRRQPHPGREPVGRLPHHHHHRAPARLAALHGALCGGDHLLLLLLHGGGVQPRGDGGESEALRRLHPRHPPGQAHRGVSRLRAHPRDRDRRRLPGVICLVPEYAIAQARPQLPPRRHQPADRRQRDDGYGDPDPEPPHRPPIWRPHQEGEAEGRAAGAKRLGRAGEARA
jgi:hypothetical protein